MLPCLQLGLLQFACLLAAAAVVAAVSAKAVACVIPA